MSRRVPIEFYNEKQKWEFINSYATEKDEAGNPLVDSSGCYVYKTNAFKRSRSIFNKLGRVESVYNKDFSDIQSETDKKMIDDIYLICFSNITATAGRSALCILKAYLLWCRDNDYITTKQYNENPFRRTISDDYEQIRSGQIKTTTTRSERIKKTIETINNANDIDSDYIFKTEDEFFSYINELFSPDAFIMEAAVCCLLYYGYTYEEIVNVKRYEVDDEAHLVGDTEIENDAAFNLILRAKYATVFHTTGDYKRKACRYCEGRYLIRSHMKRSEDRPLGLASISIFSRYVERAAGELPIGHKYKDIRVRSATIRKLKMFYSALKDGEQYGTNYAVTKLKNKEYGTLDYGTYLVMLAKINKQ